MKRLIAIFAFITASLAASTCAFAQESETVQRLVTSTDSLSVMAVDSSAVVVKLDSTLLGRNIMDVMPSRSNGGAADVTIHQGPGVAEALSAHIGANSIKRPMGYRIRIFFSNDQNARNESIAAAERFSAKWEHPVYRSYINPNFKVTVGDFRTKSEAMAILEAVRRDFPSAFIVKERIYFTY